MDEHERAHNVLQWLQLKPCPAGRTYDEAHEAIATAIKEAVAAERERCSGIVQLARYGEIDGDLRCIISRISGGDTLDEIQAELETSHVRI